MVKVLFDHNMPPAIARALHELVKGDGHEVFPLKDKFPADISDIDYFTCLSREKGWIVISKDTKQAKRQAERDVIMRSGVLVFYLRPAVQKQRINQQAATIIWQWDRMLEQQKLVSGGMFELPVNKGAKLRPL